ncbi:MULTISPECIES: hypothetical protein [unclassified Thalassolituus]|uniref:hypothetical protein n=1 Tax=unclassified Thalassolituus TaxID=2624967 RepID=UPI0025F68DB3|nr:MULTISPECIES: hypothetical protein [unclassified Thalassolituus]|tara:strand:+ start:2841 stop:3890 length:1050 start_codon:yes stop_codon:yes gene_type:complete
MKGLISHALLVCAVLASPVQAANEDLLGAIKADIAAKRLSSPAGNNALEKIDRIRQENPFDFSIVPLTYKWGEAYVELAESAISAKDYARAQSYLDKVWLVAALTPGLEEAQAKLDNVFKGKPQLAASIENTAPDKAELERQRQLAQAAAKEKARAEAEQKRKAEEEKRLAAQAKKQAAEEQQRRQQEERQRRAAAEKAEKAAQAQRLAAAKSTVKKPAATQPVASKAVAAAVSADAAEVAELWNEAKEDSAPIASYPVEDKLLADRNRDIVDSLEPVCKAILDNDASVVIHTGNKADYRWLTVRLTLCLRRMDTTFRLRHSFEAVADNNPFVTLHPSRETSLVRQSSD